MTQGRDLHRRRTLLLVFLRLNPYPSYRLLKHIPHALFQVIFEPYYEQLHFYAILLPHAFLILAPADSTLLHLSESQWDLNRAEAYWRIWQPCNVAEQIPSRDDLLQIFCKRWLIENNKSFDKDLSINQVIAQTKELKAFFSSRHETYVDLLESLVNINSHTYNLEGVAAAQNLLVQAFEKSPFLKKSPLTIKKHALPSEPILHRNLGQLVTIHKKDTQKIAKTIQVQLLGHIDTVFPKESSFQKAAQHPDKRKWLQGPGVADMKGGLVVLFAALEAFEVFFPNNSLYWQVVVTPDEEIGSLGSKQLFPLLMEENSICLIFEPAFPDGSLVSNRPGSLNITVHIKGIAAHAGRDFDKGVSALLPLAPLLEAIPHIAKESSNRFGEKVVINPGKLVAGEASNIVPDKATLYINIRSKSADGLAFAKNSIEKNLLEHCCPPIDIQLIEESYRPPKLVLPSDAISGKSPVQKMETKLLKKIQQLAASFGLIIAFQESYGVTDGNDISALGIPTIDSLGVVGAFLHTHQEYADLESLTERALLTTLLLQEISQNTYEYTV